MGERVLGYHSEPSMVSGVIHDIGHLRHLAPDKMGALLLEAVVKFLVAFPRRADVNVKFIDLGPNFFLDQMSQFHGVHTADSGTVLIMILISRADAVDNGYFRRHPAVLGPDLSLSRARGIVQTFKL